MVLGFNEPFAHPVSSFNQPVNPPLSDPDTGDLVTVCFAFEWLAPVMGALSQLTLQSTWVGEPDDILLAQNRAQLLCSMFSVGCGDGVDVRQNPESPCILQKSIDGGETWVDFADLTLCVPPITGVRVDSETDAVQTSTDGGETWVDNPAADPRHSGNFRFAMPDTTACDSAASMTRYIHNLIDQTLTMIDAATLATDATALIISLLVTLGPFGIFAIAVLAFWTLCVGTGSVIISAAFDEALYDQLLCIFFLNLETDGSMTATGLGNVYTAIDAQIVSADARAILHAILGIMGEVGLSNAGALQLDTDDCGTCLTLCYMPSSEDNFPQARCTSATHYIAYDGSGAYTTVVYPNLQAAYIDLEASLPLTGGAVGWKVSWAWTGGSLAEFYMATSYDSSGSSCAFGNVALTITSGLLQSIPADHPIIWGSWFGDGGVLHVTEVCIELEF